MNRKGRLRIFIDMKKLYTKIAIVVGATALFSGALFAGAADDKITICHATGSTDNPFDVITVSVNGLHGHENHGEDIIPMPAAGCEEGEK